MELLQILIVVFVIFASSRALLQFRNNVMSLGQFLFWQFIWLILLLFGLFSSYFEFIATFLGIQRLVDAVIYISIGLLFYLIYRIYIMIENMHQDITTLAQIQAIKDAKKKK